MSTVHKTTGNIMPLVFSLMVGVVVVILFGWLAVVVIPITFFMVRSAVAEQVDNATQSDTKKIITKANQTGSNKVSIKQSIPAVFLGLPISRSYKIKFNDDEED